MFKAKTDTTKVEQELQRLVLTGEELLPNIRGAAAQMVEAVRNATPVDTGRLRESIGFIDRSKSKSRTKWRAGVIIGARNYGSFRGMGAHAFLVEFGTAERVMLKGLRPGGITQKSMEKYSGHGAYTPRAGKSTGQVVGRRFMQKTFDANADLVGRQIIANIEEQLKKKHTKK